MRRFALAVILLLGAAVHAEDKRPAKIWNRTGPLGETPKHVTDACPLSDQENKGGWVKFEPMTDEFEGQDLDLNKWNRGMYWWKGRQPALFSDKNVTVSDGKLHLTMRKEKLPAEAEKQGVQGLHQRRPAYQGPVGLRLLRGQSQADELRWFQFVLVPG